MEVIMKIYIASSWKNQNFCKAVADALRTEGHEVDCFCDGSSGRYVFHGTEFVKREEDMANYDAIEFISDARTIRAFEEDRRWLDWADACVLILPSGRSAHLESGYAKGRGKRLFIYGDFPKGEFEVMYRFADGMFRLEDLDGLLDALTTSQTTQL